MPTLIEKTVARLVRHAASKDPTRWRLSGVYSDPCGQLIATNGRLLVSLPAPAGADSITLDSLHLHAVFQALGENLDGFRMEWLDGEHVLRIVGPDPKRFAVIMPRRLADITQDVQVLAAA